MPDPVKRAQSPRRMVVLSPHLDDGVLSCGGQIAERVALGDEVSIVTVFAGDPPAGPLSPLARRLHRSWGGSGRPMARRRAEDERSCRLVGARWLHWSFEDALYRRSPATGRALYPSLTELLGEPDAADAALSRQIVEVLGELPPWDELLVPLAVGSHVDHLLVRRAAETLFGEEGLTYYEDYPYSESVAALERALEPAQGWRSTRAPVGREAFRARRDAVLAHRSQIRSLFRGSLLARFRLWRSWRRTRAERTWARTAPTGKVATGCETPAS